MKTSRVSVLMKEKEFAIKDYPILEPYEGGAVIKVEYTGICGTDVHIYNGQFPGAAPYPAILGHEVVGTIEKLGEGLTHDSQGEPVSEGDRIFIAPGISCGKCYKCLVAEIPSRCGNKKVYGFSSKPDNPPHLTGGYAEYMQMHHSGSLFFKTSLPAQSVVLLEPLCIALHALEKAAISLGDVVVVQGSGAIGLLALYGAKRAGASKAIMVGAPSKRLEIAKELGADITVNIQELTDSAERVAYVKDKTPNGLGADVVIECAGVPAAVPEGLNMLREGGRFLEIGHFTDNGEVSINPFKHIVQKSCTIIGTWGAHPKHFVKGLRLIEEKPDLFSKIVTHQVSLEELPAMFEALSGSFVYDDRDIIKAVLAP